MSAIDIETRYAGEAEEVKADPVRVVIVGSNPFGADDASASSTCTQREARAERLFAG